MCSKDIPTFSVWFNLSAWINPFDLPHVIPDGIHGGNRIEIPAFQFLVTTLEYHCRGILPLMVAQALVDNLNPKFCALCFRHLSSSSFIGAKIVNVFLIRPA